MVSFLPPSTVTATYSPLTPSLPHFLCTISHSIPSHHPPPYLLDLLIKRTTCSLCAKHYSINLFIPTLAPPLSPLMKPVPPHEPLSPFIFPISPFSRHLAFLISCGVNFLHQNCRGSRCGTTATLKTTTATITTFEISVRSKRNDTTIAKQKQSHQAYSYNPQQRLLRDCRITSNSSVYRSSQPWDSRANFNHDNSFKHEVFKIDTLDMLYKSQMFHVLCKKASRQISCVLFFSVFVSQKM